MSIIHSLARTLADSSSLLAVFDDQMKVYFMNTGYSECFEGRLGEPLPAAPASALKKKMPGPRQPVESSPKRGENFQCSLPEGSFHGYLKPLLDPDQKTCSYWLLRLVPTKENGDAPNKFLLKADLTKRELEIAQLVREGLDDKAIARRLYISAHTV